MNTEQRDELRERNRRRAGCPKCGNQHVHELTAEQISRRADTLDGLRYKTCNSCGETWALRGITKK